MLNIGISSALKSLELLLTIKSKKTEYEIYYDSRERRDKIAAKVVSSVNSPSPDHDLIELLRAELREQSAIVESSRPKPKG